MSPSLGLAAKLYLQTTGTRATWGAADANGLHAGPAASNLVEVKAVVDLSWKSDDNEAVVNIRGNNGFAASIAALTKLELTFNTVWDPTDAMTLLLMKTKIAKGHVAAAAIDLDDATIGRIGIWADWSVFTSDKDEKLEEGQMMAWTLKPALTAVPPEYIIISA